MLKKNYIILVDIIKYGYVMSNNITGNNILFREVQKESAICFL